MKTHARAPATPAPLVLPRCLTRSSFGLGYTSLQFTRTFPRFLRYICTVYAHAIVHTLLRVADHCTPASRWTSCTLVRPLFLSHIAATFYGYLTTTFYSPATSAYRCSATFLLLRTSCRFTVLPARLPFVSLWIHSTTSKVVSRFRMKVRSPLHSLSSHLWIITPLPLSAYRLRPSPLGRSLDITPNTPSPLRFVSTCGADPRARLRRYCHHHLGADRFAAHRLFLVYVPATPFTHRFLHHVTRPHSALRRKKDCTLFSSSGVPSSVYTPHFSRSLFSARLHRSHLSPLSFSLDAFAFLTCTASGSLCVSACTTCGWVRTLTLFSFGMLVCHFCVTSWVLDGLHLCCYASLFTSAFSASFLHVSPPHGSSSTRGLHRTSLHSRLCAGSLEHAPPASFSHLCTALPLLPRFHGFTFTSFTAASFCVAHTARRCTRLHSFLHSFIRLVLPPLVAIGPLLASFLSFEYFSLLLHRLPRRTSLHCLGSRTTHLVHLVGMGPVARFSALASFVFCRTRSRLPHSG